MCRAPELKVLRLYPQMNTDKKNNVLMFHIDVPGLANVASAWMRKSVHLRSSAFICGEMLLSVYISG